MNAFDHVIHLHRWYVIDTERDAFGTVQLMACRCGHQRCDSRPEAA